MTCARGRCWARLAARTPITAPTSTSRSGARTRWRWTRRTGSGGGDRDPLPFLRAGAEQRRSRQGEQIGRLGDGRVRKGRDARRQRRALADFISIEEFGRDTAPEPADGTYRVRCRRLRQEQGELLPTMGRDQVRYPEGLPQEAGDLRQYPLTGQPPMGAAEGGEIIYRQQNDAEAQRIAAGALDFLANPAFKQGS